MVLWRTAGLRLACLGVFLSHAQAQETPMSEVTLKLVSASSGLSSVIRGRYDVESLEDGKIVHSGTIVDISTFKVSYSSYRIRFRGEFRKDMSRDVEVDSPTRFVLLGVATRLSQDLDRSNLPTISFQLRPFTSCRADGILIGRLFSVFGSDSRERQIPSQGLVHFEPLEHGKYLLVVLDGDQVRATQVVSTWSKPSLAEVPLQDCNGSSK